MEKLFQNLDVKGFFWLPDKEDYHFKGQLTGNSLNGFKLELQGQIETYDSLVHREPVIHGKSLQGHKISLINCHTKGALNGLYKNKEFYEVYEVFIGEWIKSTEDILYDRFAFVSPSITHWFKDTIRANQKIEVGEFTFLNNTFHVTIHMKKELEVHLKAKDKALTFELYLSAFKRVQDFFTFLLKTPIQLSKFYGYLNSQKVMYMPRRTDLHLQNIYQLSSTVQLFSFKKVKDDVDFLLRKWFDIYNESGDIIDPFIQSYYSLPARDKNLYLLDSISKVVAKKPKKTGLFSKKSPIQEAKGNAQEYVLPYIRQQNDTSPRERHRLIEFIDFQENQIKSLREYYTKQNHTFFAHSMTEYAFDMKKIQWFIEFFLLEQLLEYAEDKEHMITYYFANAYAKDNFIP